MGCVETDSRRQTVKAEKKRDLSSHHRATAPLPRAGRRGASWLFLLCLSPLLMAQTTRPSDVWEPLKYFVGSWKGTVKGQPGEGQVEREYRFILDGKFLQAKNKSTYPPQEKNPKGEIHEDLGLYSYDRGSKQFALRQFHSEGFVNQYRQEAAASQSGTLVFLTSGIENIPAGWRARESYRIVSPDEFIEVFELAEPGKDFEFYSESHFKREN